MPESRFAEHLTDEQLGAAFRGALQLNGIYNEIGDSTPPLQRLLADVDHEAEKKFPEAVRAVRQREKAIYRESVAAVFDAVFEQRDRLLDRVDEFFEEFRLDSAHDAIQEQLDGDTFTDWASEIEAARVGIMPLESLFHTFAATVQLEIQTRGGAK